MAYDTGTANSPADLLQKIAAFAPGYGWTIDRNASYNTSQWWLVLHKGAAYFSLVTNSSNNQIQMWCCTGYNSGATPSTQPGTSDVSYVGSNPTIPGPFVSYHLFASTAKAYIHCAIEISAGLYAHLQIGKLDAIGGADPALYVFGTARWAPNTGTSAGNPNYYYNSMPWTNYNYQSDDYASLVIRCTVDGNTRNFRNSNYNSAGFRAYMPWGNPGALADNAFQYTPNTFNGLPVLIPMPVILDRAAGSASYVGDVPDQRLVRIENLNPKDEITIGSDVWKVFPMRQKFFPTGTTTTSSGGYGLAFLKSAP